MIRLPYSLHFKKFQKTLDLLTVETRKTADTDHSWNLMEGSALAALGQNTPAARPGVVSRCASFVRELR